MKCAAAIDNGVTNVSNNLEHSGDCISLYTEQSGHYKCVPGPDHYLFSEKIPADCLDMAASALFYTDPGVYPVPGDRTGFSQEQDVQGEGDRRRAEICCPKAGGDYLPEEADPGQSFRQE